MSYKFEIYKDKAKEFRWRLKSSNGRIMGDSGEGYTTAASCIVAVDRVKTEVRRANVAHLYLDK